MSVAEPVVVDWPGFLGLIGPVRTEKPDGERWLFSFTVGEQHLNPGNVCHGGMLMSFADHVLGTVVWESIGHRPCSTITLNCDFVTAAKLGDLVEGEARITRSTRSLIFVNGLLTAGGKVVLQANGIWKVLGA
ncbi:PaaI family thioesterase [Zavarzinia sp.]|uniref:PaaI family thioesterase n=1 Tax=Zavarzinia sp. TaxID=2027920 RepID=UPI0035670B7C